ncbi:hypothetical protein CYMTET_26620 [Cymbomonas tetramitiformis]|uniref:ZN622/Rei1/Reh1 zinc finger C2H2-type domain-containing protein n=1 Tax=Cymbomonas tetramitiformis TaxID=36881 RepID=A0AAE0FRD8_9CHLO|nr:hypothetical protein CYMTET_26620 [Cymbomonas tetramitiformis]
MSLQCNTAPGVAFASMDDLKAHYKTEWHRYNLKRKAASLPLLSKELFDQMQARSEAAKRVQEEKELEKQNKKLGKKGKGQALVALEESKGKSKLVEEDAEMEEDDDEDGSDGEWEEMSGDEAEDALAELEDSSEAKPSSDPSGMKGFRWDTCDCLFSKTHCETPEAALEHMGNKFGFFLPDKEYVADMKKMMKYLAAKIQLGSMCLYCEREFKDPEGARKHMIDKGHCKLKYGIGEEDAEEELEEFYDYSSQNAGDAGGELVMTEAESAVGLTNEGLELTVGRKPDGTGGRIIGSREFATIYKQKVRPSDEREEVLANKVAIRERNGAAGALMPLQRITAMKQIKLHREIRKFEYKKNALKQSSDNNYSNANALRNVPY